MNKSPRLSNGFGEKSFFLQRKSHGNQTLVFMNAIASRYHHPCCLDLNRRGTAVKGRLASHQVE
ncbi:MAG: hypothetical protein KDA81_13815 [Planctomycetaceae bacterium]|nr:hypothetical protein [Planctomycetaceae bacterium]